MQQAMAGIVETLYTEHAYLLKVRRYLLAFSANQAAHWQSAVHSDWQLRLCSDATLHCLTTLQ